MMTESTEIAIPKQPLPGRRGQTLSLSLPPRLSVIVCTYNRRQLLLSTLQNLCSQTLAPHYFEILIVDNGSIDGTQTSIQNYICKLTEQNQGQPIQSIRYLYEPEAGLTNARNKAITYARGEIFVFLDDDTLADRNFLERLLQAYDETDADAIGVCVGLRWETHRPYWFSDDFQELLGYFMPARIRHQLITPQALSSCCFSLKSSALQRCGGFLSLHNKRRHTLFNSEIIYLSYRLYQTRCKVWFEPKAIVLHRIPQIRAQKAFIINRAYWEGRSEILATYQKPTNEHNDWTEYRAFWNTITFEIKEWLFCIGYNLRLRLSQHSTNDRVRAAIRQAYQWGRVQQLILLFDHTCADSEEPEILLIRPQTNDAIYLEQTLQVNKTNYTSSIAHLSLKWIWQHRAISGRPMGIIQCYSPGGMNFIWWQQLWFLCLLLIARILGLLIITTDTGGWWQHVLNFSGLIRRFFELIVLSISHIVQSYARCPEELYRHIPIPRPIQRLSYPDRDEIRELPPPISKKARQQMGLPHDAFVYLCLAASHSIQEISMLIQSFKKLCERSERVNNGQYSIPQLCIVGLPHNTHNANWLIQQSAQCSALHLILAEDEMHDEHLAMYLAASNVLVVPHHKQHRAGTPDIAMHFYLHQRLVIIPDLPRFRDIFPRQTKNMMYSPGEATALYQTLLMAQEYTYQPEAKKREFQQTVKRRRSS